MCGRTGSGKSTLLSALWRLVPSEGRVSLGGQDLSTLPLATLRAALCIVPQEPLLLQGSLRFNLDPWGAAQDSALLSALQRCGLGASLLTTLHHQQQRQVEAAAAAAAAGGGGGAGGKEAQPQLLTVLDVSVEAGGGNLSLGQQQLVCLARAMLRPHPPPLICLDEAASTVDAQTQALLALALKEGFPGSTVLVVAHKLESILDFDAVMVLDRGCILEMGPPQALLQQGGAFARLVQESRKQL